METMYRKSGEPVRDESLFQDQKMLAELYVHSANTSTSKSVWAYMLLIVVSITTLMAIYNEKFSFTERFLKMSEYVYNPEIRRLYTVKKAEGSAACDSAVKATEKSFTHTTDTTAASDAENARKADSLGPHSHFDERTIHGRMLSSLVENFVESQYFTFPIIGIKIHTADVTTILSICILLIFGWCYACIKNENLVVGKVLSRTYNYPLVIKQYILSGIAFKNVFFPISYRKKPYDRLPTPVNKSEEKLKEMQEKEKRYKASSIHWQQLIAFFLFSVPILLSLCSIYTGLRDLFNFNDAREILETLYRIGGEHELYREASEMVNYEGGIWGVLILSVLVMAAMIYMYIEVVKCLLATSRILFNYKNSIKCELEFNTIRRTCREKSDKCGGSDVNFKLSTCAIRDLEEISDNQIYGFSVFSKKSRKNCFLQGEVEQLRQHLQMLKQNYSKPEDCSLIDILRKKLEDMHLNCKDEEIKGWCCILLSFDEYEPDDCPAN